MRFIHPGELRAAKEHRAEIKARAAKILKADERRAQRNLLKWLASVAQANTTDKT